MARPWSAADQTFQRLHDEAEPALRPSPIAQGEHRDRDVEEDQEDDPADADDDRQRPVRPLVAEDDRGQFIR